MKKEQLRGILTEDKKKYLWECVNNPNLRLKLSNYYKHVLTPKGYSELINEHFELGREGFSSRRYEIECMLCDWVCRYHFAESTENLYDKYKDRLDYLCRHDKKYQEMRKEFSKDPAICLLDQEKKASITKAYNELLVKQGKLVRPKRENYGEWDKPYLKIRVGRLSEIDKDFHSCVVSFSLRSKLTTTKEENEKLIKDNLGMFRNVAFEKAYERISKSRFKGIEKNYLEIKKIVYRQGFNELFVTIGLKDSILKLKEEFEKVDE